MANMLNFNNDIRNKFIGRIRSVKEAGPAHDILSDMYMERHNYFGREYCYANNIQYRNDVSVHEIVSQLKPDISPIDVEHIRVTPDNYLLAERLYIIDYKVSTDSKTSVETKEKYENAFRDILADYDWCVVIVRINPVTMMMHITDDAFQANYGNRPVGLSFDWFFDLRRMLMEKFRNNEEFINMLDYGDFTMTLPWLEEDTPELYDHPIYKEFIESMSKKHEDMFYRSLNHCAYGAKDDKWNSNLVYLKDKTEDYYKQFIKKASDKIFLADGNYSKPSRDEILKGWEGMTERIHEEREVICDISKQKPSIHMIWGPNDKKESNDNIPKILKLAKRLQNIKEDGKYVGVFKQLGKSMDFSKDIGKYEVFTRKLKMDARSAAGKKTGKIEPVQIGDCTVLWEQQFKFESNSHDKYARSEFYKDFLGIGGHKEFSKRNLDDIDLSKPKILDFNDRSVQIAAKSMVENNKIFLKETTDLGKLGNLLDEYMPKIEDSSNNTAANIKRICSTRFWQSINDFSVLMRNMLSVSHYNKYNSFRVVTCANNNVFGIVFPSSDIKTKKATLLYITIVLHDDDRIIDNGCLYNTYKTNVGYVSISKAMRLDKERCQRIVSSPGLFMLTSLLFLQENESLSFYDVLNFSFYTSLSITKAMLTLTEPSRYMIMNSLAISSNVRDYIAEKFSPYTKTLFSVYMTNLIKQACLDANAQRDKVKLRDIFLSDYDITQKGIRSERNMCSIWFPGKVNMKEYINQVYLPFYFNSKGLHEKHHVMIDLAKTILEIEKDQRINIPGIWGEDMRKQTVNIDVLIHSLAINLMMDTSRHKHLRFRVESRNNFKRNLSTISTFTSSKSCIKVGDFHEIKNKEAEKKRKASKKQERTFRAANPLLVQDEEQTEIHHSDYIDIRKAVPDYVDMMTTKVFDRLYEKVKSGEIKDYTIKEVMKVMKEHKQFYFAFFNKGQKTAKDREIYEGEFEAKMCLYCVERIAKERCKLNPEEMISEPGDSKLKVLEQKAEDEIRYIIEQSKERVNKETISAEEALIRELIENFPKSIKMEINADMSKWSAQDVMYKYFWLIAMDPILYPDEKKRILYFLCNYMQKRLILPDDLIKGVLDQRVVRENDLIAEMTNNFSRNWVEIKRNWLQGNLNYTSSYLHSCAMYVFKDIMSAGLERLQGECLVNSLVHSDDNQTSIVVVQDKLDVNKIIQFSINSFENSCLTFGNQLNLKKTYIIDFVKEFVSLFNIYGEPFSIYGRFLLTCVGDCAYIGPYEDLASRLSSTQTAIKHGCPPSIAWVSIALNQWITYSTYSMMPGQQNDPMKSLPSGSRFDIPVELGGFLNTDLPTLALVGLESGNLHFLTTLSMKMTDIMHKRESILEQTRTIDAWDLSKLSEHDILRLKMLRYVSLDSTMVLDGNVGETSDMRSRSLITPRKFTTAASLNRLTAYKDYLQVIENDDQSMDLFQYLINNPELLVTKGETYEQFQKTIVYRFNSKKFKESLSIQNPAQLFIEQVLFSNKPVVDYTGIREKFYSALDIEELAETDAIIGRKTIAETFELIRDDLDALDLTHNDIKAVYNFCLLNDPLLISVSNSIILQVFGVEQERLGLCCSTMPELRNTKLIQNSPAIVLRAYIHGIDSVVNVDRDELQRDIMHLEEFIRKTNLVERMRARIELHEREQGEDAVFKLRELTRFYQVCYDYIKSTEHKVKVFILPARAHTSVDFCALIRGNLIKDSGWFNIYFLRQIESNSHKGQVLQVRNNELETAAECFKLICHFADWFISGSNRKYFVNRIIDEYYYKGIPVRDLYSKILNSEIRVNFIGLLLATNQLELRDINSFEIRKSDERVVWNDWQSSQKMNTGIIDLVITGTNKSIQIRGRDDRITEVNMRIKRDTYDQISAQSRKLLNTRHNLAIERMQTINYIDSNIWYLCFQRARRNKFDYVVLKGRYIIQRDEEIKKSAHRSKQKIFAVCEVNFYEYIAKNAQTVESIKRLNFENDQICRTRMNDDEWAIITKARIEKMAYFNGPEIIAGAINVSKLMSCRSLLSLTYETVKNSSLMDIVQVFHCEGEDDSTLEFGGLSEDPLDTTETISIDSMPVFDIYYRKKGTRNMSYQIAFREAVNKSCDEFARCFDLAGDGFASGRNLGLLKTICVLIKEFHTNEWSSILDKCIHLCMYREGLDETYHAFEMDKMFLIKTTTVKKSMIWGDMVEESYAPGRNYDWEKLIKFIDILPEIEQMPWKEMFETFKRKARELLVREMNKSNSNVTLDDLRQH
uniref:RNA-directed RNA polymerase L n=1 Tax=Mburo virus TaxID=2035534 RepID=A0A290GKR0_9VIRU|nr:RNA-dependent RNA polymerase [Mburo virus]